VTWELDTARTWRLLSQIFLGEWADMSMEWPALLLDAKNRGDLYAEVYLSTFILATIRLAGDEPDRALVEADAALARWSPSGFHVQHHNHLVATTLVRLYKGEGTLAWDFVRQKESLYRRAMLWRVQQIRIDFLQLRARSAILAAAEAADPRALLRSADRDARALQREAAPWGQALGHLMHACVEATRSKQSGPDLFEAAATQLDITGLGAFAAAARYRQGLRTAGGAGLRLQDDAVAWMVNQGVLDPLRMIGSHAPTPTA
jgi:hypothetical protein